MAEQGPTEVIQWLLENWTTRLADSLEGMLGERPGVAWRALDAPPSASPNVLWWEQPLSLRRDATFWAGAAEPAWMEIGSQILRGAGIEVTDPQDAKNTYLEVLSQSCAGLAQAVGRRLSTEVTCKPGKEETAPPPETVAFEIEPVVAGAKLTLYLCLSPALLDVLRTDVAPSGAAAVTEQLDRGGGQKTGKTERVPRTLDLLMEIELPVSVSFGRAQLPLKDVLKLSTGSIVELNRAISEPVEVIVNNCVIARGEVVVVEGNYGVRIHEIISRERRLRTLQ